MTAEQLVKTMEPRNQLTRRTYRVCIMRGGKWVLLAKRATYRGACNAQDRHAGSIIVTEFIVSDPDASDLGTIYWYDENGGQVDLADACFEYGW